MQVDSVIGTLIAHSGKSARSVSAELGKSPTWASNISRPGREGVALATIADVADVAGCDVVIRDRATGETVGVVEPPRR